LEHLDVTNGLGLEANRVSIPFGLSADLRSGWVGGSNPRIEACKNHEQMASHNIQKEDQKQPLKLLRNHRFWITFGTSLTSWAHQGEDLGAKGKPSGFQRPLREDFGGILVPIGTHLGTLLDNKLAKKLFWDAFEEVLGRVSKKTPKFVGFLTLPNPLD